MCNSTNILKFLKDGKRLKKPKACPEPFFDVMIRMWNSKKTLRPSTDQLQYSFLAFIENPQKFGIWVDVGIRNFADYLSVC